MKVTVVCISIIVLFVICVAQTSGEIDPESFVGFWHFDEGTGKTVKDDSGNGFDGIIDEVALFNVALSADEVIDLMEGLAVYPAGKLAMAWGSIKIQ